MSWQFTWDCQGHSVCGLPVIEHTDFGKEIVTYDGTKQSSAHNLGNIFNMGNVCNNKVSLILNSLAMHTFITGSTGSGKSNTVYEIVRQLDNSGINYLIIEPAKGEYKMYLEIRLMSEFWEPTRSLQTCFGLTHLNFLKASTFLNILTRLVEIFNVCWSMYAAMPAVLKDAILQAYQSCGWELSDSTNQYSDNLFPTFGDLLTETCRCNSALCIFRRSEKQLYRLSRNKN